MPFRTWVAGETPTAANVNDFLQKQVVIQCTSGTRPGTPVEGMVIYETDTDKVLTWNGTTWILPKNVAEGLLAAVPLVTADQTGIGTTITDLTGLSVTVTVSAGRRIRVSGHGHMQQISVNGSPIVYLREGTTQLGRIGQTTLAASEGTNFDGGIYLTPTTGSHTYKLSMNTTAGTVNLLAQPAYPASIAVEDVGAL